MRSRSTILLLSLAVLTTACDGPRIDKPRRDGGAAPDPAGVIEGTVLYRGPPPLCERDEDGRPVRVRGRVVLTLFRFDDPPPPEGSATTSENLLTLPAALLFDDLSECLPAEPTEEDRRRTVMGSAAFSWPEVELGHDGPVTYQIRGFFDRDADFIPFFSVSNQPTEGDVAGGAFVDSSAESPRFAPIELGAVSERPEGQRVRGVAVTLGATVQTERPLFHLHPGTQPLSSEAPLPATTDPAMAEREIYALTETRLRMFQRQPPDPGADDDPSTRARAIRAALDGAGLSADFDDPYAYAWYVRNVDLDGDGEPDPHPILGETRGIRWQTPIAIFRRIRTQVEQQAGIPDVVLLPSVRPTRTTFQKVFFPTIELAVVPVAVVTLNPAHPACQIPYVTPGAPLPNYERTTTECQEVPTGTYAVNVFQGLAGGQRLGGESCASMDDCPAGTVCDTGAGVCNVPEALSATQRDVQGGSFSGQAWSIPNELADPTQVGEEVQAPDQGLLGAFFVHDPDPASPLGRADGRSGCVRGTDPDSGMERDIAYRDFSELEDPEALRELCCAPVRHLCGVDLCDPVTLPADGAGPAQTPFILRDRDEPIAVRGAPTAVDADGVPDCVPFRVPAFCCE